jgi:SAM-dependent methyltransferase
MGLGLGIRARVAKLLANTPGLQKLAFKLRTREQIFSKAYSTRVWGSNESYSGRGSELGATESLRSYLPRIFERLNVKTFLDAPCGDWNWMRQVDLSKVKYIGADIVPDVIKRNQEAYQRDNVNFIIADLTKDSLPKSDLILCRDCWVHLSFEDIADILENFRQLAGPHEVVRDQC